MHYICLEVSDKEYIPTVTLKRQTAFGPIHSGHYLILSEIQLKLQLLLDHCLHQSRRHVTSLSFLHMRPVSWIILEWLYYVLKSPWSLFVFFMLSYKSIYLVEKDVEHLFLSVISRGNIITSPPLSVPLSRYLSLDLMDCIKHLTTTHQRRGKLGWKKSHLTHKMNRINTPVIRLPTM